MTLEQQEQGKMEVDSSLASGKNETLSPPTPSQLLLRRVLSHGSNGATPTPLSPPNDDATTPQQANAAKLHPHQPENLPDMHQLHFRSPNVSTGAAAWTGDGGLSTTPGEMGNGQQWQPDEDARSYALAAQSVFPSEQGVPVPPEPAEEGQNGDWARRSWRSPGRTESTNSLNYAAEAFANNNNTNNNTGTNPLSAQPFNPFAQVAQFGSGNGNGHGPRYTAQSASAANSPTARARAQHQQQQAIQRQSSKSSTRTASTSSEESDLCIPSIEWVNQERERQPFYAQRMPPPPEPRTPYLAVGASATTPLGITQNQSLPSSAPTSSNLGGHSNIPDSAIENEEEDDAATVGQGRESPSTSSQSAQSGLDLLWKAVAHHESVPSTPAPVTPAPPSDRARGKRKAGQEVVAQWRSGGYGGTGTGSNTMTAVSALRGGSPSQSGAEESGNHVQSSPPASGGPRKRRRSQLDAYDPALTMADSPEDAQDSTAVSEYSMSGTDDDDDNSEYNGGSSKGRKAPARGNKRAGTNARPKAAAPKRAKKGTAAGAKGRKASAGEGTDAASGTAQGVQCNYVFPRAPFPRCKDFFTRKYDLPRHMARHARREGELVYEGKLTEAEATLWKTIKDKPRVHCPTCGESFTRMDALKRHQTKQHHT